MREIKLRAWDTNYNAMITNLNILGKYIYLEKDNGFRAGYVKGNGDWQDLKIMQYTGLKDKNGKERYEGNIFKESVCLSPDGISSAHNIYYHINVICKIFFIEGQFIGKWTIDNHLENKYKFTNRKGFKKLSINQVDIGNIYENPELINE